MRQESRTKIDQAIRKFHERAADARDVLARIDGVLDIAPESPLYVAVWALIGGYIEALGSAYSINGWLEWWWEECDLGAKPKEAGLQGEELRVIATVDDLVHIVLDDLEQVAS